MPQMTKGGKYIFGKSRIREDGSLQLPPQAVAEYGLAAEKTCISLQGAKSPAGFV